MRAIAISNPVAWASVNLSVCLSRMIDSAKRLNGSRFCLGGDSCGPKTPHMGVPIRLQRREEGGYSMRPLPSYFGHMLVVYHASR